MEEKNRIIGSSPSPADFETFWRGRGASAQAQVDYQMTQVDVPNPGAEYYALQCTATDGALLRARYLCPAQKKRVPTVLMFHDYDRGIRGWHHMTRFLALGYGVLALENRTSSLDVTAGWETAPDGLAAAQLFTDALTAGYVALDLPRTDPNRLMTWGEGLGGGLAIAAAAMLPCAQCGALNPLPADYRRVWELDCSSGFYGGIRSYFRNQDPEQQNEDALFQALGYVDCANFAPLLGGSLLLGTALMDTVAPPESQNALFHRVRCQKQQILYPKYMHERINFFENELLKFLYV